MTKSRCGARALVCSSAQLVLGAGAAFVPAQALAGPVEVLADITVHPSDGRKIVLGYENGFAGLLVSGDGGRSFRLRPSRSVHTLMPDSYFPRQDFPILLTADALLVGGTGGLLTGDAETCGLTQGSALLDDTVSALAPHPSNPDQAFLASFKNRAAHGGLFRRDELGVLAQLGRDDEAGLWITGLEVVTRQASSEHLRFVETGARLTPGAALAAPFVRYSDDLGVTWIEHAVTLPGGGTVTLLAVDPLDADRVLIMGRNAPVDTAGGVSTDPADDVLLSLDAGQTFTSYSEGVISAHYATFAPDGRFWLGDVAGGLYFAKRLGDSLSKVSDVPVRGLWFDKTSDELLVAQSYELGRFKTTDYSYCQMFRIYEALAYPTCSNEDIATDADTTSQVCGSFCNATHYWYAPVCRSYHDVAGACGLGVIGTAFAAQLPNTMNAAKRCDGFPLNYTDPANSAADAGTSVSDGGGSADATSKDGGAGQPADSAAPPPRSDAAACTGGAAPPCARHDGGCNVSVTNAPCDDRPWGSAAAATLLYGATFVRRSGRTRSRARFGGRAALLALTLLALLGGSGCGDKGADVQDASSSTHPVVCPASIAHSPFDIDSAGAKGTLHARVVTADHDPARKHLNTWTVALSDGAREPVNDARFENQRTYMPVHGHDGAFPPTITREDAAPGQYELKDLNFIMTGPWQVQFDVSSELSGNDRFSLDVCVGG